MMFSSLNSEIYKISSLSKTLDLGFKFVPNIFSNDIEFFKFLLTDLDNSFINLNKKLFLFHKNNSNSSKKISKTNDMSDDIINSLKTSNFYKNLNLNFFLSDTLDFRYELLNFISYNNFSFTKNISKEAIYIIKNFIKQRPFKILQCDKNIGFLLISNENFKFITENHLFSNSSTYIKLDSDPLNSTIENVNSKLLFLLNNNHICNKLYNCLTIKDNNDVKLGKFRILPKIHKNKFSIRPIINCISHPTSKICQFIDILLQPFILNISTILKDSQNLIQKCDKTFSYSNVYLYSCDFESLYTNIKPLHAISILTEFFCQNININLIDSFGFRTLLEIIFNNNTFSFENYFFQQVIGVPMGCKCGPSIANLFLYIIEKSWLDLNSPLIYARFIDDIFCATTYKLDLISFQNHFDYLKLNIVENETVNFLDLSISFDPIIGKFIFSLYIKPTNTFSYLLPSSNHPQHIFKNIPKSLFIRIRRICTSYIDFLSHSRNLFVQLLKRNYNPDSISKCLRLVSNINRDSLLPYKPKKDLLKQDNTLFFYTFDNSIKNLNQLISNSSFSTISIPNVSIKPISLIQNNIGSFIIHNKPINSSLIISFTKPCNKCKICKFVNLNSFFKIRNLKIPLFCNSTCETKNIVYLINCSKCNLFYIGESSKMIKQRISQHLLSISSFSKNLNRSLSNFDHSSPVAEHFARNDHTLDNFSFFVFQKDVEDSNIRKSIENNLINLFIKLNVTILNKLIPSYKKTNSLCFVYK